MEKKNPSTKNIRVKTTIINSHTRKEEELEDFCERREYFEESYQDDILNLDAAAYLRRAVEAYRNEGMELPAGYDLVHVELTAYDEAGNILIVNDDIEEVTK